MVSTAGLRMIRLFTTVYPETNPARRAEYEECLRRNLACAELDEVCVLAEGDGIRLPPSPKLRERRILKRPSYDDFFSWINEVAGPDDVSIIANTDIYFDSNIRALEHIAWRANTCLALSRWDVQADGTARLFEAADSQDCWIFKGKIGDVKGDIPVGVYDCDNKIAWELERAGYNVLNPSLSIRCFHLHLSGYRSYEVAPAPDYGIRPPFKYVEPDNLAGLWTCWRLYRKASMTYFPWRLTGNKIRRWGPVKFGVRVVNRVKRRR